MQITSSFEGGNIRFVGASAPHDIRLEIRKDSNSDFYQWFYFRVSGAKDVSCGFKIVNAGGASYPDGWKDYRVSASYDRKTWFRVQTTFDGEILTIPHRPEEDSVFYAYFPPYSMERHSDMIAQCLRSKLTSLEVLGASLDGQDIDLLTVQRSHGTAGRLVCWVIARQHPGETQAEWWMEGFLRRLLDESDPVSRALLDRAVFHVVPNMNPDGSRRGNLRTNAAGANLNREWDKPSMENSPEVFHVKKKMQATGCDFFLDVHGDEALPYNFIANTFGIPSISDRQRQLTNDYKASLMRASPDFQTEFGYPENK
ncbi:MAG: M14-type cytosolic carboxypeptidase, partial [Kiloniellales bacterium]|nr:M14-type cytosolic carboxypeptidase [Kiloniellales bacterium]